LWALRGGFVGSDEEENGGEGRRGWVGRGGENGREERMARWRMGEGAVLWNGEGGLNGGGRRAVFCERNRKEYKIRNESFGGRKGCGKRCESFGFLIRMTSIADFGLIIVPVWVASEPDAR
jgi:hypothetical protein